MTAQTDAEKALLAKQKQMAAEAARRQQQQQLTAPQMNATAQSRVVRSVPDADRRKTTRLPSGATGRLRGAPRVKRWVRAARRGYVSLITGDPAKGAAGSPERRSGGLVDHVER